MRVAFLRHTGPYTESGPTFQKMMAWAFSKGLFNPQTKVLSICHDDPEVTPQEKIRLDCCITVGGNTKPEGEVELQTIPDGEYVVLTHRGSYNGLAESTAGFMVNGFPPAVENLPTALHSRFTSTILARRLKKISLPKFASCFSLCDAFVATSF